MHSLRPEFINNLKFTEKHISYLKTLGEYKGKQELYYKQTPEVLKSLKETAIIESSESSNRLEGITAPHNRIEAIIKKSTEPKNRSEQEIAGYRDALNLIHESAEHMDFSTNVILQIHSLVYRYMPGVSGRWKMTDNEIVEKNANGTIKRVRFKAVPAVATPQSMDELVKNYKFALEKNRQEPLMILPLAILDFLCIHPFDDGNGRVARLLTLLVLYHYGYEVGRYISLERIFEESKETYYETLEASSQNWHEGKHDPFPWLNYFWGTLIKAYKEFEERVGQVTITGKGAKTEQIRKIVSKQIGPFSISDIEKKCRGTSRDMVRLVLRQLRDEGVIVSLGKGRSAKWELKGK